MACISVATFRDAHSLVALHTIRIPKIVQGSPSIVLCETHSDIVCAQSAYSIKVLVTPIN